MTRKYRYTVHSAQYSSRNPRTAVPTGRIIPREPQVLFNPHLADFGLLPHERVAIAAMPVGRTCQDHHGDVWERIT